MEAATVTVPERSHEQRMAALARGNKIRQRRKELKIALKAGRTRIESLVLDPPDWAHSMRVLDALVAVPKVGEIKAGRLLRRCRISHSKTIGGLSERQRSELAAMFTARGWLS